jgi:hypothetical protein
VAAVGLQPRLSSTVQELVCDLPQGAAAVVSIFDVLMAVAAVTFLGLKLMLATE